MGHSHDNSFPGYQNRTAEPKHRHESKISLNSQSVLNRLPGRDLCQQSWSDMHLQNWPFSHANQIRIVDLLARCTADFSRPAHVYVLHFDDDSSGKTEN